MKIEVLDRDKLDRLIASVSDSVNEWGMDDWSTCYCGHSRKIYGENSSIEDIFPPSKALDNLTLPEGWTLRENPRYSRDNAIRVLESIRDTGEFEW